MTDTVIDAPAVFTLADRQQQAEQLGLNPAKTRGFRIELDLLRRNGLLVDLELDGFSMFFVTANWEELGVSDETVIARFGKGRKSLLPKELQNALRANETRRRANLQRFSYQAKGFYPYRWIPVTAYAEWKAQDDEIMQEFQAIKDEIIERHAEIVEQTAADFHHIGAAAWRALTAQAGVEYVITDRFGERRAYSRDEFIAGIVQDALARIPTVAKIRAELVADYHTAFVWGEQDVAEDQAIAAVYQAQARQVQAEADASYAVRLAEANAEADIHRQRALTEATEQETRRSMLNAMRQAELERARELVRQTASPFAEILMQLRGRMADDCREILDSLRKNGYLRGNVAQRAKGLLSYYKLMAAHDDRELSGLLEQLSAQVGKRRVGKASEDDGEAIASTLADIINLTHAQAQEVTERSRAAFIDL